MLQRQGSSANAPTMSETINGKNVCVFREGGASLKADVRKTVYPEIRSEKSIKRSAAS
jgi:hypothetical protein